MLAQHSFAIDVGDITTFMHHDQNVVSKSVTNDVNTARGVILKLEKVSSPLDHGVIIPFDSNDELLATPATSVLPAGGKEVFNVYYNGPKDNEERYYRLVWHDLPIQSIGKAGSSSKRVAATTSARIATILVVAPRNEDFKYRYDSESNELLNEGNVSFRVSAFGPCDEIGKKICNEKYNILPSSKVALKYGAVNKKQSAIGIWHKNQFIPIN